MRSKKALFNALTAILAQIVGLAVGIIIPRFTILIYGSTINGLCSSVNQAVKYLYILELGLSGSLVYSLYKPITDHNIQKINGILAAAKKSYHQIGVVFSAFLALLAVFYPLLISKEKLDYLTVAVLFISIGAAGTIDYFTGAKYTVYLMAAQKGYISSIFKTIYYVVNYIIIGIGIYFKLNIALAYFLSLFANLLNSVIVFIYMKRKYSFIDFSVPADRQSLSKRYDVLLHQVSAMVDFNVPVLVLTLLGSLKEVSVYTVYSIIFAGINMIFGVFTNGLSAGFGELIANKEVKLLKNAYSEYEYIYYIMIAVIYSCTVILGLAFVKIYTHGINDADYIDFRLLLLFTVIGVLNSWKIPQSTMIIAAGHYRQTIIRPVIESLLTITFCIGLTYRFGIYGTLSGSLSGLVYRAIDLSYAQKITDFKFRYTLVRLIRMFFLSAIVIAPFFTIIHINPSGFIAWIFEALLVAVWALAVVLFGNYLFEREAMQKTTGRIISLLPTKQPTVIQ